MSNSNSQRTTRKKGSRGIPNIQPFACVIKQYGTGLYRSCVSLERNSALCLSIHEDERSAREVIDQFLEGYQRERLKTMEDIQLFIDSFRDLNEQGIRSSQEKFDTEVAALGGEGESGSLALDP